MRGMCRGMKIYLKDQRETNKINFLLNSLELMESLSNELLLFIFEFLSMKELARAETVCKKWRILLFIYRKEINLRKSSINNQQLSILLKKCEKAQILNVSSCTKISSLEYIALAAPKRLTLLNISNTKVKSLKFLRILVNLKELDARNVNDCNVRN